MLLIRTVGRLSGMGSPTVSTAIQDITRVSQILDGLEQKVDDQLKVRQSQLGALMGVGRADQLIPGSESGARRSDGYADRINACRARLPDVARLHRGSCRYEIRTRHRSYKSGWRDF